MFCISLFSSLRRCFKHSRQLQLHHNPKEFEVHQKYSVALSVFNFVFFVFGNVTKHCLMFDSSDINSAEPTV